MLHMLVTAEEHNGSQTCTGISQNESVETR